MDAQKSRRNDEQESVKFIKVEPVSPKKEKARSTKAKKESRGRLKLKPFGKRCTKHTGCKSVPEEGRQSIRSQTSALSDKKLQKFVISSVVCRKFNVEVVRYARQNANKYYLTWNGKTYRVCRAMYISTIGVTQWTIRNWKGENPRYRVRVDDFKIGSPKIEEATEEAIESKEELKTEAPPVTIRMTRKPKNYWLYRYLYVVD